MNKDTFKAYPVGSKVHFGHELCGEIVKIEFMDLRKIPIYNIQWWTSDGILNECWLFEQQFEIVKTNIKSV